MNRLLLTIFISALGSVATAQGAAPLKVAATNGDLASLVKEIGGDLVTVDQLVPSTMEPHSMPLRPSMIQKVRDAALLVTIGLDHEPWLFDLVTSSGNGRVQQGGAGYVDVSSGIALLQVPVGAADRSRGDLHIFGNTHYWLDPRNARIMAVHITHALCRERPQATAQIRERTTSFLKDLDGRIARWKAALAPHGGRKAMSYHLTWAYLEAFCGFQIVGTLEIKPGIEPSPAHLTRLRETARGEGVKNVFFEPYFNRGRAQALADDIGAVLTPLPVTTPEGMRYADHMDRVVALVVEAFAKSAGSGEAKPAGR